MNNAGVQDEKKIPGLLRELGAAHAASIVVGVVIGSGIFLVPAEMMRGFKEGTARYGARPRRSH